MTWRTLFLAIAVLAGTNGFVLAHESRPGYLELRQIGPERFDMVWKVPMRGDLRLGIYPRLPEACVPVAEPISYVADGALIKRQSVHCPGGLTGQTIRIDGLSGTMTDVLVRLERLDGTTQIERLSPSSPSFVVEDAPNRIQVAGTYMSLGIEHILLGIDHLLFVACLIFLAGTGRRIFITITGFTLAHSLTLALSALNVVRLPVPPVEAAIALSIVFLAVEIARGRRDSLTYRWPMAVSATFGLLHGFGFATALRQIGLPEIEVPTALLFFNVGVEIGQLVFVFAIVVLAKLVWRVTKGASDNLRSTGALAARVRIPVSYAIGIVASYWLTARLDEFWR